MKRENITGGWVDYREPEDTPERLRRRVTTMAGKAAGIAQRMGDDALPEGQVAEIATEDMQFLLEFNDAVAMCLVMGWSFDSPVTSDGLLDVPAAAYDEIIRHGQALVVRLLPNFSIDPDPKALTAN